MDDSGTKHPNHTIESPSHNHDWFAFGGVLINDEDIPLAEKLIDQFRAEWPEIGDAPLHSSEIRGSHDNFKWLHESSEIKDRFIQNLERLLIDLPVLGIACVIDRPGYNYRYKEQYGPARWNLCKTAFAISVERAAKYAMENQRKLRVYVERSSKTEDAKFEGYYKKLKADGHWFDGANASKYAPLEQGAYASTLYEFKTKKKSSRLMQIADIFLWPMCMGGYGRRNRAYLNLKAAGKFIDCHLPENKIAELGIKYSCFEYENSKIKNEKAEQR